MPTLPRLPPVILLHALKCNPNHQGLKGSQNLRPFLGLLTGPWGCSGPLPKWPTFHGIFFHAGHILTVLTPYLGAHPRSGRFSTNSWWAPFWAGRTNPALDSGKKQTPGKSPDERVLEKCDSAYCDMVWLLCHLALQKRPHRAV